MASHYGFYPMIDKLHFLGALIMCKRFNLGHDDFFFWLRVESCDKSCLDQVNF